MSKRLVLLRQSSIDSDDIDEAPIGGMYMELAYISVGPSSCGGSRMCMLSGVASYGLAPTELTHNTTTVEPPSEPMTMLGNMGRYTTIETLALCLPDGLGATFRKLVPDFVGTMLRRCLGTNEARRVWMALCEGWVECSTP